MTQVVTGVPKELHDKAPPGMVVAETAEEAAAKVEKLKQRQAPNMPPGMLPGMQGMPPGMMPRMPNVNVEPLPEPSKSINDASSVDDLLEVAQSLLGTMVGNETHPAFQQRIALFNSVMALVRLKTGS